MDGTPISPSDSHRGAPLSSAAALALLMALLLAGCAPAEPLACDAQAYEAAVRDAAQPTAADLSSSLWRQRVRGPGRRHRHRGGSVPA